MRGFLISFFGNTFNRRKFFYDDLEKQISLPTSDDYDSNTAHEWSEWDRLFDTDDIVETALLMECTLKFCIEYKTNDGKCNRCKEGYQQKNGFCHKNDSTNVANCVKYDGSSNPRNQSLFAVLPTSHFRRQFGHVCVLFEPVEVPMAPAQGRTGRALVGLFG